MGLSYFALPTLVRMKPGTLERLGIYLKRSGRKCVALLSSAGLPKQYVDTIQRGLAAESVECLLFSQVQSATIEEAHTQYLRLPPGCDAVLGIGGGKALDVAKYAASLARVPYFAVPLSLANDGFCSPQ